MIYLQSFSLEHFRGFYEKQILNFAIPNNTPASGLTVIVGPNNSGKTTIKEAIRKFRYDNIEKPPIIDKEERHDGFSTRLEMINTESEIKILTMNGGAVGKIDNPNIYPNINTSFHLINSERSWDTYFGENTIAHDEYIIFFNIYGHQGRKDQYFGLRMIAIENDREKKEQFTILLKKLIPEFTDWHIESSKGQRYIEYITGKDDRHSSEFLGDGVISLFKIALALISGKPGEILFIDEPELSLHPQAQKSLISVLGEFSKDRQIIITTHSPYFVRWQDISHGAHIIRLNKYQDTHCTIGSFINTAEYYERVIRIAHDWQKPHLLDTTAKEIFFGTHILFVEGQEDMGLLSKFIREERLEINFQIFGYGSNGAGSIQYFLEMAKGLGIRAGALFDGNELYVRDKCKEIFPEYHIESLSTDDIRDKKDKNILGMFNESGEIKDEYRNELLNLIQNFNKYFAK